LVGGGVCGCVCGGSGVWGGVMREAVALVVRCMGMTGGPWLVVLVLEAMVASGVQGLTN